MTNDDGLPILTIEGITKRFPGVVALDDVSLTIRRGEIHILLGENGAGKSSLVKILAGVYQPDAGSITFDGAAYRPQNPVDALRRGVRVVYQELNLLPYLSVAENIFFEHLPQRGGTVDYRRLYSQARAVLAEIGLDVSPQTLVQDLGIAQMQLIEIAKALTGDSKLLILDEPTATLTPKEISRLFSIIHRLRERGVTIIYISHHLQEIFEIGDRMTVLRNGRVAETRNLKEVTIPQIVTMMVGRDMQDEYLFRPEVAQGAEMLRVENVRYVGNPHPISFAAKQGEILGIAGLVGSGRTETMRAIFGADPKAEGRIVLDSKAITINSPQDAVRHGICLLTEDRKSQGLLLDMPIATNITITNVRKISRLGLLQRHEERNVAAKLIGQLGIKTPSPQQLARNLSGGNQQKVVLAKWLFRNTRVLIFDEPTRGIDVGAKYEIYTLLWQLAEAGKALIVVSSDLPELMGICHRIVVFSKGTVAGEVARDAFDQERILSLAYQEYMQTGLAADAA